MMILKGDPSRNQFIYFWLDKQTGMVSIQVKKSCWHQKNDQQEKKTNADIDSFEQFCHYGSINPPVVI